MSRTAYRFSRNRIPSTDANGLDSAPSEIPSDGSNSYFHGNSHLPFFEFHAPEHKSHSSWWEVLDNFRSAVWRVVRMPQMLKKPRQQVFEAPPLPGNRFDHLFEVRSTLNASLDKLLSNVEHDGRWRSTYSGGPLHTSIRSIALAYLGVEENSQVNREILHHLIQFQDPNGGFALYQQGPTSKAITRIVYLAILVAMRGNQHQLQKDAEIAAEVETALTAAKTYLHGRSSGREWAVYTMVSDFCWDLLAPGEAKTLPGFPFVSLFGYYFNRFGLFRLFQNNIAKLMPALLILHQVKGSQSAMGRLTTRLEEPLLKEMEEQIVTSQDGDGAWIETIIVTALNLMALKARGYELDDPTLQSGIQYLKDSAQVKDGELTINWCVGDMWDTSLHAGLVRLADKMSAEDLTDLILPHILRGVREDRRWSFSIEGLSTDNDTTSVTLATLSHLYPEMAPHQQRILQPIIVETARALLNQQQSDGGWAGFDPSAPVRFGASIPAPEMAAFFDPSTPDVSGRVISGLLAARATGALPEITYRAVGTRIKEGLTYFAQAQCLTGPAQGSYWSRWIAGPISGTAFATIAMRAADLHPLDKRLAMARDFALRIQDPATGGWGESALADRDASAVGQGPFTPLQTGLAIMILIACCQDGVEDGYEDRVVAAAIDRGVRFILSHADAGEWEDRWPLATIHTGLEYFISPENSAVAISTALLLYDRYKILGASEAVRFLVKRAENNFDKPQKKSNLAAI